MNSEMTDFFETRGQLFKARLWYTVKIRSSVLVFVLGLSQKTSMRASFSTLICLFYFETSMIKS